MGLGAGIRGGTLITNVPNKSFFRRDALITVLVIVGFTIAAFGFHLQERIFTTVREPPALTGYFGEVFLAWGIWSVTLAALILGLFISLDHYWRWITTSFFSILIVWTIDMSRSNFKGDYTIEDFLGGLWFDFVLFTPFTLLVAWCIYYVRKKLR